MEKTIQTMEVRKIALEMALQVEETHDGFSLERLLVHAGVFTQFLCCDVTDDETDC